MKKDEHACGGRRKRWEWMTPWRFTKRAVSEGSDEGGSRDPVAHPVETSIAQRTAPDLVLWSDEPGGLLEPAQEERKPEERKERPNWSKSRKESCARANAHEFPQLVQPLRASKSRGRSTSQTTTQRARVPDHHGGPLLYAGCTWQ